MKRVLVGVDGSEAGAAALGWAGRFARVVGAEVLLATAFQPDQAEVFPDYYEELRDEAERRLDEEWSEPLEVSGTPHRSLLLAGSPETLLKLAEDEDVDLMVVGPRGHSRFDRLHVGSVAHHLARYTTRPLAIVPAPGAGRSFDRIVVGVDGSEGSACAVRWCADLARAADAEVIVVYAFEPLVERVLEADPRSWRHQAERKLQDAWTAPLRDVGISVRIRIVEQIHPVRALVDVIEEESAGLAVVGTRGIGGFLGLRLGRVPLQLVHHTQIPVVLVPPAAAPDVHEASATSEGRELNDGMQATG
jgi:nucleotide-binding universal stress UspA family protein